MNDVLHFCCGREPRQVFVNGHILDRSCCHTTRYRPSWRRLCASASRLRCSHAVCRSATRNRSADPIPIRCDLMSMGLGGTSPCLPHVKGPGGAMLKAAKNRKTGRVSEGSAGPCWRIDVPTARRAARQQDLPRCRPTPFLRQHYFRANTAATSPDGQHCLCACACSRLVPTLLRMLTLLWFQFPSPTSFVCGVGQVSAAAFFNILDPDTLFHQPPPPAARGAVAAPRAAGGAQARQSEMLWQRQIASADVAARFGMGVFDDGAQLGRHSERARRSCGRRTQLQRRQARHRQSGSNRSPSQR